MLYIIVFFLHMCEPVLQPTAVILWWCVDVVDAVNNDKKQSSSQSVTITSLINKPNDILTLIVYIDAKLVLLVLLIGLLVFSFFLDFSMMS